MRNVYRAPIDKVPPSRLLQRPLVGHTIEARARERERERERESAREEQRREKEIVCGPILSGQLIASFECLTADLLAGRLAGWRKLSCGHLAHQK